MNTKCGIAIFLPFCEDNTRELVAVSQRFLFFITEQSDSSLLKHIKG